MHYHFDQCRPHRSISPDVSSVSPTVDWMYCPILSVGRRSFLLVTISLGDITACASPFLSREFKSIITLSTIEITSHRGYFEYDIVTLTVITLSFINLICLSMKLTCLSASQTVRVIFSGSLSISSRRDSNGPSPSMVMTENPRFCIGMYHFV